MNAHASMRPRLVQDAVIRNVIVPGYPGVGLHAVCLVVEQDLPALADALDRMAVRLAGSGWA